MLNEVSRFLAKINTLVLKDRDLRRIMRNSVKEHFEIEKPENDEQEDHRSISYFAKFWSCENSFIKFPCEGNFV